MYLLGFFLMSAFCHAYMDIRNVLVPTNTSSMNYAVDVYRKWKYPDKTQEQDTLHLNVPVALISERVNSAEYALVPEMTNEQKKELLNLCYFELELSL